jgi:hypothetical protein
LGTQKHLRAALQIQPKARAHIAAQPAIIRREVDPERQPGNNESQNK